MPTTPSPVRDFHHAVARQFANRPTLRQVTGEQLMKLIRARYPLVATHRPQLTDAQALFLMVPQAEGLWKSEPLVDVLLQALIDGRTLDFSPVGSLDYRFSLDPPQRFYAIPSSKETADGDVIKPEELTDAFNGLLPELTYHFLDAQLAFCDGERDDFDRATWLREVLRAALLREVDQQRLDALQQSCLLDLLAGRSESFSIQAIEVEMSQGEERLALVLPNLLVSAGDEVRTLLLWCAPDGQVRGFDDLSAFATALRLSMSERYRFEHFAWNTYAVDGDCFTFQVGLLFNDLSQSLARLAFSSITQVDQLQSAFSSLSDPSRFFAAYESDLSTSTVELPDAFDSTHGELRTLSLAAMLELTIHQQVSKGRSALPAVESLHGYAAQRLREQMLADHPVDANYFPDDLLLTVERFVNDQHGVGFPQRLSSRQMTLTALAIENLVGLGDGVITGIAHREQQLIMPWMNTDYVRDLVARVDIGGSYPGYLDGVLQAPAQRAERVERFAQEWRLTLLFDGLGAQRHADIGMPALRALLAFCKAGARASDKVAIGPLAFRREAHSLKVDEALGMFVIRLQEPDVLLLYRPLYPQRPLVQFINGEDLMEVLRLPGPLPDSVLTWLDQNERPIYDHGGFKEPHLPHWVFDPYAPTQKPAPVQWVAGFWGEDIDERLYQARRDLMLAQADRSSVSNSEQRWAMLQNFSWQLFNLVTPVLEGPLACVTWLYLGVQSVVSDMAGLVGADENARTTAIADILNNTLMVALHLRAPVMPPRRSAAQPPILQGMPASDGFDPTPSLVPMASSARLASSLASSGGTFLDFSWRGGQGLGDLTPLQRARLRELAADVSLAGRSPQAQGPYEGLYLDGQRYYVKLADQAYLLAIEADDVRIVTSDGRTGPLLCRQEGTWRIDTRLRGGSGREGAAAERLRTKLQQRIFQGLEGASNELRQLDVLTPKYREATDDLAGLQQRLTKVTEQRAKLDPQATEFERLDGLYAQSETTLKQQIRTARLTILERIEQMTTHYRQAKQVMERLRDNPTYRDTTQSFEQLLGAHQNLLSNMISLDMSYIEEVMLLCDLGTHDALVAELNATRPAQSAESYRRYRESISKILELQPRMQVVNQELDKLLSEAPLTLEVQYRSKQLTVQQLIDERTVSTVSVGLYQAMNLVELALHLHHNSGNASFGLFRERLSGERLCIAAQAHDLLNYIEPPLEQRAEILQNAWQEYLKAIFCARRVKKLVAELIDVDRLEAYERQMAMLKELAGDALVQLAEAQAGVLPRRVYHKREFRVARTGDGQLVVGREVESDGQLVLEVQPMLSERVVHRFHWVDDAWVEGEPDATAKPPVDTPQDDTRQTDAARLAQRLLDNNDEVLANATDLIGQDGDGSAISSLIGGQLDDLEGLREQLQADQEQAPLVARLDEAVVQLRQALKENLALLYASSPYPSAKGLRFLSSAGLISVKYSGARQLLADKSALDKYKVTLLVRLGNVPAGPLWEAHFHYNDPAAAPREFDKAHLKRWGQRQLGRQAQVESAQAGQVLKIHRGDLKLADVEGVIPF